MGDGIMILGGIAFWILAGLCYFRVDLVWKLYSLEPRWRKENPERTEAWDNRTRRSATIFALAGVAFVALGGVGLMGGLGEPRLRSKSRVGRHMCNY